MLLIIFYSFFCLRPCQLRSVQCYSALFENGVFVKLLMNWDGTNLIG